MNDDMIILAALLARLGSAHCATAGCELTPQDDEAAWNMWWNLPEDSPHEARPPAVSTTVRVRKYERVLTLRQYGHQGVLERLFGALHLLLVLRLLAHQPPDMAVGRLDHGVEVIGGPAVDLTPVDPGEQHRRGLAELMVICRKTQCTGVRDSY